MVLPVFIAGASLAGAGLASAQVRQADRFEILRVLIADHAAARIVMPLGGHGVRLSEAGVIDENDLAEELGENGRAISPGQVVEITDLKFGDHEIEVELDDGGESKRGFLDRLQVGIGASTTPVRPQSETRPHGSKVVLRFDDRVPEILGVEDLRTLLSPVLDFGKQNFMDSGVESLPLEFQEAVRDKRVVIGMDRSTVTLARGRPSGKSWETNEDGIEEEIWMYDKVGFGADFLTFEDGILVKIRER